MKTVNFLLTAIAAAISFTLPTAVLANPDSIENEIKSPEAAASLAFFYEAYSKNTRLKEACQQHIRKSSSAGIKHDIYYAARSGDYESIISNLAKSEDRFKLLKESLWKAIGFINITPEETKILSNLYKNEKSILIPKNEDFEDIEKSDFLKKLISPTEKLDSNQLILVLTKNYDAILRKDPSCTDEILKLAAVKFNLLESLGNPDNFNIFKEDLYASAQKLLSTHASYRSTSGYRQARWGMTPLEVAKAEGLSSSQQPHSASVKIGDYPARVEYRYTEGRLTSIRLEVLGQCKLQQCYERFHEVSDLLSTKYGKGNFSEELDEDALSSSSYLYQHVARDAMYLYSGIKTEIYTWTDEETAISTTVYGDDKGLIKSQRPLTQVIVYESVKLKPWADAIADKKEAREKKKIMQNL